LEWLQKQTALSGSQNQASGFAGGLLTYTVARTTTALMTPLMLAANPIVSSNIARGLTIIGFVNALGVMVLLLNRRGHMQAASVIFVAGLVLLVIGLAPTAGILEPRAVFFLTSTLKVDRKRG